MTTYLFFCFIVAALVAVLQANENDKLRRRLADTERELGGWKSEVREVMYGDEADAVVVKPKAERLVFTVPAPPQELSPNRSRNGHWSKKSGAVKEYRALASATCKTAMQSQGWSPCEKVRVGYWWWMDSKRNPSKPYRPTDDRNAIASLKALDDGIVDAGLVPDDSYKHWQFGEIFIARDEPGSDFVIVYVERLA